MSIDESQVTFMGEDVKEGAAALVQKRKPVFR